ncbi:MAG: PAS domain S-box protein [Gammaproteobacteria bacterium]|nr:PAS domain S-box protein [Gammaproteobacteria bacterium]
MTPDHAAGDARRPLISAALWAPFLLILAACGGILYYGLQLAAAERAALTSGARATGLSVVNEIVGFIDREHERLAAFTDEKGDAIRKILAYPDDWPEVEALQTSVRRMFRGALAFSVTGPDGVPLFEDFDGLIGPVCRASMRDALSGDRDGKVPAAIPPIHPVPGAYHFDLITPWVLDSGDTGLFFVSMSPDRIAELIAAAERTSGYRILLVNRDDPSLIEIANAGARDRLGGDFRVAPELLVPGHFAADLPGTHWRVLVLPDAASLDDALGQIQVRTVALVLGLLGISAVLLYLIRSAEKRNSSLFMRSLQSSVSRQRAILQSMVDGMVTINADGEILHVNSAITRLFGYQPAELVGSNVRVLMPDPHRSNHDDYMNHYLTTGESRILGTGREVMAQRKDGSQFPILLTLGESVEGDEHIFVGILHDMTAYKEAQNKLAAQAMKIERSRQELDEISQIAANDLQLPLQRIATLGEMLSSDSAEGLGGDERAQLKHLGEEARDMSELVKGIADYTRADERSAAEPVDLVELLATVRNDLAARIEASAATFDIVGSGRVLGDATQVRQLLWNLVDNALKFSDPARPPVVTVAIDDSTEGQVTVRVRDNGIGIPEGEIDAVFEAFKRLHPRERYPGMGLGLSFCRKIADGLGGEIAATSRVGEGSEFRVTLPRAD